MCLCLLSTKGALNIVTVIAENAVEKAEYIKQKILKLK